MNSMQLGKTIQKIWLSLKRLIPNQHIRSVDKSTPLASDKSKLAFDKSTPLASEDKPFHRQGDSTHKLLWSKASEDLQKNGVNSPSQQALSQQSVLMQIAQLEKALLCSLSRNEIMIIPADMDLKIPGKLQFSFETPKRDWIFQLNNISEEEHLVFLFSLMEIHTLLNSCYIISRRLVVKTTVENMAEDIDALLTCFLKKNIDNQAVAFHLRNIYNDIESLRFSANRDNRCSRSLLEKTKMARKLFKRACQRDSVAEPFLHGLVNHSKKLTLRR